MDLAGMEPASTGPTGTGPTGTGSASTGSAGMEPAGMLTGRGVLRVVWLPGSDVLRGRCHCGAVRDAQGPVEVWEWLLAHPAGHFPEPDPGPPPAGAGPERAVPAGTAR
ncbi:hypothetical protein [Nonomuraea sp. NPDC050783]|uniref:hypothetical protein n=1 Tax=Nonomuraea sp. NPDC050783 TaxID=3154634 RepID=UPI0034675D7E